MSDGRLRLALWAQRRGTALPLPVRRVAGRALARVRSRDAVGQGPTEDWSIPLLPGRDGGNVESLETAALAGRRPPPPVGTVEAPNAILRCVVATGVLDVGGMDEFVGFLGRRLPSVGVETVVVYASKHEPGTYGEGGRGVRALEASGVQTVQLSPETCRAWLASHRPEVISAHGAPDWLLDAAAELSVPWVETLHGVHTFLDPRLHEREEIRAGKISAQIAVSELVRRQYVARIKNFPPERTVTVPNGVDEQRIRVVDRAAAREALGLRDEFLFVSLARYCLQKNIFGLVSAFAEVAARHSETHLLVAGRADDPLYFHQVRALTEGLSHADRIHLRGHCANPSALLAAADAFVLDSFFEGWPLASMEALTVGIPVILSDVGGAREQLGDGQRRGYLVDNPGGDPELVNWATISDLRFRGQDNKAELVAALSALVRDRVRWAADRQRLRDEARAAFSAELCLRRHAAVLHSAAHGAPIPDLALSQL